jgi:hypothetical protein
MSSITKDQAKALVKDAGSSDEVQKFLNSPVDNKALLFATTAVIDLTDRLISDLSMLQIIAGIAPHKVPDLIGAIVKDLNVDQKLWAGVEMAAILSEVPNEATQALVDAAKSVDPEKWDEVVEFVNGVKGLDV